MRTQTTARDVPEEILLELKSAGLVYVCDSDPGITRRRAGRHFSYRDPDGAVLRDEATLARIRKLAIPPAYTGVWICANPNGHLQATGRDQRGRKQYRYHPSWRAVALQKVRATGPSSLNIKPAESAPPSTFSVWPLT